MDAGFCDNGAGASGVVELARVFAEAVRRGLYHPKYTIVFVAFADEELDLVGSLNYVKTHKAEMGSIVAVINLDCIGSQEFYFTETVPAGSLDLDQVVQGAAQSLGIAAAAEAPGGSDQDSFRDPASLAGDYYGLWGVDLGISDAVPVRSSVLLISYPLTYADKWNMGVPGWIHTSYDNSTSTATLNWVEVNNLEAHIEVAALTGMRVSPSLLVTDLNQDGRVNIQDITMVAVAFGSKPGDTDWNAIADLDRNGVVNILDITMVAKDYGKTL
jgi:Zn-dependent M28 family amino/carboxypeptidase